jgi:hypothetical protein
MATRASTVRIDPMPEQPPLHEFLEEAKRRLGESVEITATVDARSYTVTARLDTTEASSKMRKDFFDEYLRSGRVDCCDCVEHFFDHLAAKLNADELPEKSPKD